MNVCACMCVLFMPYVCICRGKRVYIHCNGGKGRGATVAIASLMALQDMPPEKAYAQVRQQRAIANMRRLFGVLPQWRAVAQFKHSKDSAKEE